MSAKEIKNHMVWAIISLLMCWPLGIPALLHALNVNKAIGQGNDVLAQQESAKAKKWCKITTIVAIVLFALGIIGAIVVGCVAAKSARSLPYYY